MTLNPEQKEDTNKLKTVNVAFENEKLFRPVVFDWTKNHLVVFTNTWDGAILAMDVTKNPPKLEEFDMLPDWVLRSPKLTFTPNAVAVYDEKKQAPFVYTFGWNKYPYALRLNAETHEWEDLNPEDEKGLQITTQNKIGPDAKACSFVNKYIIVTSKENGFMLYDISKNRFVIKTFKLTKYANNLDSERYGKMLPQDMDFFGKTATISDTQEQFMALCKEYIVFINIKVKDNGNEFQIHANYFPNTVTNKGRSVVIYDFGCYFWEKHGVLLIIGGSCNAFDEPFSHINILDIDTGKYITSSIVLPNPIAGCGVTYMQSTDSLYIVGGVDGHRPTHKTQWIKMNLFEKDIQKLKNPNKNFRNVVKMQPEKELKE